MESSVKDVVAVVLAGGFGTRIQHLLPGVPKPMAPVGGRPFLEWLVRYLARQGVRQVVLSTGYLAGVVAEHFQAGPVPGVQVHCVAETTPLGTAGAVRHAIAASGLTAPVWAVMNGDTLCFADLPAAVADLRDPALAGVMFAREVADAARYGSLAVDARGCLTGFVEKRPGAGLVSTGVYLLRDELMRELPGTVPLSLEKDWFPALTARGVLLRIRRMTTPFLDIGTPESLPLAEEFVRNHALEFIA